MSRLMTKPTKWHVRPVWSESSLSTRRNRGSLATNWAHSEDCSDWADAQADLSSLGAQLFYWFCREVAQMVSTSTISDMRDLLLRNKAPLTINKTQLIKKQTNKSDSKQDTTDNKKQDITENTKQVVDLCIMKYELRHSWMDGWVRVLRPFNSISVISWRWKGEHERLCAMKRRLGSGRISPPAGFERIRSRERYPLGHTDAYKT